MPYHVLVLLQRRYSESIGLLYIQNKLIFDDSRSLTVLPPVIPRHRFKSIQFIPLLLCFFWDTSIDLDT
jgi:hypothetical protein